MPIPFIPTWMKIIVALAYSPKYIGKLCKLVEPSSRTTVYKHIKYLKERGIVDEERIDGKRIIKLTDKGKSIASYVVRIYMTLESNRV